MTIEQNKMESAEKAPVQRELELDMEPITPKKHPTIKPTLLEKAKSVFSGLGKKNGANETNFSSCKEPTIHLQTTHIETEQKTQESPIPEITIGSEQNTMSTETQEPKMSQEIEQNGVKYTSEEPIKTVQENLIKPENWSVLGVLPPKYRRIFIALLIAVFVLLIISWLKPSSDVVQSFEQPKGNTIPTQFQSLDQSQPIEHNVLDQLNNPPQNVVAESENQSQMDIKANEQATSADTSQNTMVENPIAALQQGKNEQVNIEVTQPIEKPVVIEKAKSVGQSKIVEKNKNVEKAKIVENKQLRKTEKKGVPIVEAKPASTTKTQKTVSHTNIASKTLVVPQGTSLMQVFRNNNLNIADVNAMTKASGAGNVLSNFKPGDKVQISLNSQGRVNELRLSNGARFIRQADGSYQFKK